MVWPFTCCKMLFWFLGGMARAVGQARAQGAQKGACGTSTYSATNRMGTIQDSRRASLLPQREHKPYGHPDSSCRSCESIDFSESSHHHPSSLALCTHWLALVIISLTTSLWDRANVDKSCTDESCMNMYEHVRTKSECSYLTLAKTVHHCSPQKKTCR